LRAIEENMGWSNYMIVQDNISIMEQAETQRLINQASEDIQTEAQVNPEAPMPEQNEQPPSQ